MKRAAGLVSVLLLLVACEPIPFLTELKSDILAAKKLDPAPGISPAGGVFRLAPNVTLSGAQATQPLFYTVNGAAIHISASGQPYGGTLSSLNSPFIVPPAQLYGVGVNDLRVVSWNGSRASAEARALFYIGMGGSVDWARTLGTLAGGQVLGAVHLGSGNTALSGWTTDSQGRKMATLTMVDTGGALQWQVQVTSANAIASTTATSSSQFGGVASDSSGNLYVAGSLTPSGTDVYNFGSGITEGSVFNSRGFVAKYSATGACLWVASLESSALPVRAVAVAVSNSLGRVFVAGTAAGGVGSLKVYYGGNSAATIGGGNSSQLLSLSKAATAGPQSNGFVTEYDLNGVAVVSGFSSGVADGSDELLALSVDDASNTLAVAGRFRLTSGGILDYGGTDPMSPAPAGQWNALLLVFSATSLGFPDHVRGATGGSGDSVFNAVATGSGTVVAGGQQSGAGVRNWGPSSSMPWTGQSAAENAVAIGYSVSGASIVWIAGVLSSGASQINALIFGASGSLFAAGRVANLSGTWGTDPVATGGAIVTFSGGSLRSGFFARFDAGDGGLFWARSSTSGSPDNELYALTHDGSSSPENLILGGSSAGKGSASWGTGVSAGGPTTADNPLILHAFD